MYGKKVIKGIVGLSVIAGISYLAYKLGEGSGEISERYRDKHGDADIGNDDFRFYGNMDEPDDGCIAPVER